jgi:O-antigen/teichoic acid export membrane protein
LTSSRTHKTKALQARIVSGSVVLLSGSGLTTAINLAYNLVIARYLGPKSFGHATVVYTLLTLLSAITLSYQIVCSKIVAQQQTEEGKAAAYRMLHRSSWSCGLAVGLVLFLFESSISGYLNLPDPTLVALLAVGVAFYIPLGTRRGYIQGTYGFRGLAANMVLEGAVRLGGSFALVLLGFGVRGVIAANAAAVAVAYLAIPPKISSYKASPIGLWQTVLEMSQALFFFAGQVLINNCDIVLVKHLFSAQEAGIYSAVAMVGRVIFSFSQAVVNSTFPLVAGTGSKERRDLRVIGTSLLLVFSIGSVMAIALYLTPPWIWSYLFGAGFEAAGRYSLSYLQAMYAVKTVIYSLCAVIITYEMSYKIANTSWIQLLFSGVLIEGMNHFHSSLREVIVVQIDIIVGLLVCVAIPFLIEIIRESRVQVSDRSYAPVRVIRPVSEDEVIGEFLKSDFHRPEFLPYRDTFGGIVARPNFADPVENAKRRALLFTMHLSLWAEIPDDTSWYEVEINQPGIGAVRAFPRAQWRKIARGSYSITEVSERLRSLRGSLPRDFLSKIDQISDDLARGNNGFGAVLLIGTSESGPLTILDGNHRLVAALEGAPDKVLTLRFMCGLSSRMNQCCWYHTSPLTLFRYAKHLVSRAMSGPDVELARLLRGSEAERPGETMESEAVQVSTE